MEKNQQLPAPAVVTFKREELEFGVVFTGQPSRPD
jgi:hypothetical protein